VKPDFHLLVEKLWGVAYVAEPGERGHWLYVSPRIDQLLGFSQREWLADPELWARQIHLHDRQRVLEDEQESSESGGPNRIEYRLHRKSGEVIWVSDEALVSTTDEGVLWYGVLSDITDRKFAEEERAKSEERYRSLVQNAPDGISVIDPTGAVIYSSPANARILGRAAEATEGSSVFSNLHPDDVGKAHAVFKTLIDKPGLVLPVVLRIRHEDGGWRWLEINATSMVDSPNIGGVVVNFRDITDSKELERELLETKARFEAQYRGIPIPTYTWRIDGDDFALVDSNIAAYDITNGGIEKLIGISASRMYGDRPDIVADFRKCAGSRENVRRDMEYEMISTGELRHFSVSYAFVPPDLIMVHTLDVTEQRRVEAEQRRLEDQLRQAQKMEAIGRLAGGVAHDFNNLLAVILNYTEFLKESLGTGDSNAADLGEISAAAQRGARLVQQLLAFSRKQLLSPETLDLNDVVFEMEQLLRQAVGRDIEIMIAPDHDLWSINADVGQIEQALLNLAVNARDAMPRGGRLSIETANVGLNGKSDIPPDLPKGSYVRLEVKDSGSGMSDDVKAQIFEPFFTTKAVGVGTGLGLATVYGTIKQADGHIRVESQPGAGTSFELFFPAVKERGGSPEPEALPAVPSGGGLHILVVDDEAPIRKLIDRILTTAGHEVRLAASGSEALGFLDDHRVPIDLIICDVVMPQTSGTQLAEHSARVRTPPPPVLFMSGFSDEVLAASNGEPADEAVFLGKPFTPEDLLRAVSACAGLD
jgi:two-component system, cell cycle sensor histidine kinase and response regulator CckA